MTRAMIATASLVSFALSALPASAAISEKVGIAGAVNPQATGLAPGEAVRTLTAGGDVVFNDTITTGPGGQVQLLMLDRSAFNVGPSTKLVIDDFVYDRSAASGRIGASVAQGVLRFVGGAISKNEGGVSIKTPTATLGIRGGVGTVAVAPDGTTTATFLYGEYLRVTSANGTVVTITRPGYSSTVAPGGDPSTPSAGPANPTTVLAGSVGPNAPAVDVSTVNGQRQAAAGAAAVPPANAANNPAPVPVPVPVPAGTAVSGRFKSTVGNGTTAGFVDQASANSSVPLSNGQIDNNVFTATDANAATYRLPLATGNFVVGGVGTASARGPLSGTGTLTSDGEFFFADLTETNAPSERAFLFAGVANRTPVTNALAGQTLAFALQPDAALGAAVPFVRSQLLTGGGNSIASPTVSNLLVRIPAGSTNGVGSTVLQASLGISGSGPAQQSIVSVAVGDLFLEADSRLSLAGFVRGSSRTVANDSATSFDSSFATVKDGGGDRFFGQNGLKYFVLDQNAADTGTLALASAQERALQAGGPLGGTAYGFTTAALPGTVSPAAAGAATSRTINGFAAGLAQTTTGGAPTGYSATGSISITTNAVTERLSSTVRVADPDNAANSIVLALGGASAASRSTSAFISDKVFAAIETRDLGTAPATLNGATLVVNGSEARAASSYLLTSDAAPAALPNGVTACDCSFAKWGYWGTDLRSGNNVNDDVSRRDRVHLGTWVAGPQIVLPLVGSATYNGHAVGSVNNNGNQYLAAGVFTGTYDFGARQGTVAISGFDGKSFSVGVTPVSGTQNVATAGPVPFGGGAFTATATAGFFGTNSLFGASAAEMGGQFRIANAGGTPYQATGVFVGKR